MASEDASFLLQMQNACKLLVVVGSTRAVLLHVVTVVTDVTVVTIVTFLTEINSFETVDCGNFCITNSVGSVKIDSFVPNAASESASAK